MSRFSPCDFKIWLVVILVLAIASSLSADPILKGVIYQKDLLDRVSPLSDAYVEILSLDNLHVIASATTNSGGSFIISSESWTTNTYRLRASKRGYVSRNGMATLWNNRATPFSVTLTFDPYNPPPEIFNDPSCIGYPMSGKKAYAPDGTRYARSYASGQVGIYDLQNNLLDVINAIAGDDLKAMAWSRSSQYLALVYHGTYLPYLDYYGVTLYNVQTGLYVRNITRHQTSHVVFSLDDSTVFISDSADTLYPPSSVDGFFPSGLSSYARMFVMWSGVNLPWEHYGWDLGVQPWGGAHGGYSDNLAQLDADFAFLAEHHVRTVRIFLFADLRTGLLYDTNGIPIDWDSYVYADMDALVTVAEKHNIKLIPVLFDYKVADGVQNEGSSKVGEHPELITNATKRANLASRVQTFVYRYRNRHCISAWEIINEPECATAVTEAEMQTFVLSMANSVRSGDPKAFITCGSKDRSTVASWTNYLTNVGQFHYYDVMEPTLPFDYPAKSLNTRTPVLIGECQPTNITSKLDSAYANGYAGVLFWSLNANYDFRAVADVYSNWVTTH